MSSITSTRDIPVVAIATAIKARILANVDQFTSSPPVIVEADDYWNLQATVSQLTAKLPACLVHFQEMNGGPRTVAYEQTFQYNIYYFFRISDTQSTRQAGSLAAQAIGRIFSSTGVDFDQFPELDAVLPAGAQLLEVYPSSILPNDSLIAQNLGWIQVSVVVKIGSVDSSLLH